MNKWHCDKSNLDIVIDEAINKKIRIGANCCSDPEIHIYCHRFTDRDGSAWGWCSRCGSYSHLFLRLPIEWKNLDSIQTQNLVARPDYLEREKDQIDKHLDDYLVLG